MVEFKSSKEDMLLIGKIADRVASNPQSKFNRMDLMMDLDAVHSNGCPLDFGKLLAFPEFDFWHDIFGISNHIDRTTGELTDCFLPRCAKPEKSRLIMKRYEIVGNAPYPGELRFTGPSERYTWNCRERKWVRDATSCNDGTGMSFETIAEAKGGMPFALRDSEGIVNVRINEIEGED